MSQARSYSSVQRCSWDILKHQFRFPELPWQVPRSAAEHPQQGVRLGFPKDSGNRNRIPGICENLCQTSQNVMKNVFSALSSWYCPSKIFSCEGGSATCYLPANSHCHRSHESSHFSWSSGIRKHVRIPVSTLKSLCMWCKHLLKESGKQTNKQPETPKRNPLPGKEWKYLPPCPPKLFPWFCRVWLTSAEHLGLTVLQTQLQNKSCGYELLITGKLN